MTCCANKSTDLVNNAFFLAFGGEYTLFAGLEQCLKFVETYKFNTSDIDYLRTALPDSIEEEFYNYLLSIDMNDIKIYAVAEGKQSNQFPIILYISKAVLRSGSVIFPHVPLLRVEGPILKAQLLETTLLTLVNYASLVATNAARFRAAAEPTKKFYELGLRRAQGPDGGLSASKYCYLGGFDGTSNVLAGKMYGIPIRGN